MTERATPGAAPVDPPKRAKASTDRSIPVPPKFDRSTSGRDLTADEFGGSWDSAEISQSTRRVAPFIALGVAVVLAVFFVILAGAKGERSAETSATHLLNKPAPAIVGNTLDGSTFDLSRRRGSWVVLNFFQSTCVPCIQEHPEVVAFAEQQAALGPDGAELVTIIFSDRAQRVQEFFDANGGGDWPVVLEGAGVSVDYGVTKVPETWVIDPNGRVVWRTIFTITADGLAAQVQQLRTAYADAN
jgi:cytochrome c biogenesis protein CcmG, thiol:disulfide interchange protein DsbE